MKCITVLYPAKGNEQFDFDCNRKRHLPLIEDILGSLRVRGVSSLRIIDASIMPNVPAGNTNAPTIMIAEKGADIVRGRALPPESP